LGILQSKNGVFDSIAQCMLGAANVSQGVRREIETIVSSFIEQWLQERHFVTLEEHNMVRTVAFDALEKVVALEKDLNAMKQSLLENTTDDTDKNKGDFTS
jgi:BMFP domain-containing protein YqiC